MAGPPLHPHARERDDDGAGIPRWLRVLGVAVAVVVVLVVTLMFISEGTLVRGGSGGGGGHERPRHGGLHSMAVLAGNHQPEV